jgi:hypothetical protein
MINSVTRTLLGLGMVAAIAAPASDNTLYFVIKASDIYNAAINTSTGVNSSVGNTCSGVASIGGGGALPFCGIYAVGIGPVTIGAYTSTSVAGAVWGVTSSDAWVGAALPHSTGVEANDNAGGTIAYIASQATGAGTTANLLATSNSTNVPNYSTDVAPGTNVLSLAQVGTPGNGVGTNVGILSATTQFTFYATFTPTIADGTTANLNLELLLTRFRTAGAIGNQQAKGQDTNTPTSGSLVVSAQGFGTPEPASFVLMLGGLGALVARYRRRRA